MEISTPVSEAREIKASNLHITAEKSPMVRANGDIERLGRRVEGTGFRISTRGKYRWPAWGRVDRGTGINPHKVALPNSPLG